MPKDDKFTKDTWVQVLWSGSRLIGQVTSHVTTPSGHEFVGFMVDDVEYVMPPGFLKRTLNPYLEDLVNVLMGEDLAGTGLEVEEVRLLIAKISNYLDAHKEALTA